MPELKLSNRKVLKKSISSGSLPVINLDKPIIKTHYHPPLPSRLKPIVTKQKATSLHGDPPTVKSSHDETYVKSTHLTSISLKETSDKLPLFAKQNVIQEGSENRSVASEKVASFLRDSSNATMHASQRKIEKFLQRDVTFIGPKG